MISLQPFLVVIPCHNFLLLLLKKQRYVKKERRKREDKWEWNIQSSMMADSVCSSLHDLHDISMNTSNTSRVGGIVQRTGEIQSHCSYW